MGRPMEGWAERRLINSWGGNALDPIAGEEDSRPDNSPSVGVLSLPGLSFRFEFCINNRIGPEGLQQER